ncbi:hypothetical protein BN132_2659 [Cronobacter turicensis 564]|nr:hypothetical protein BN132_2659 [Cronobacter turicensis 564]
MDLLDYLVDAVPAVTTFEHQFARRVAGEDQYGILFSAVSCSSAPSDKY